MSWYNDESENNFIDATQEHTGGGGGSSLTIVNEPTITDTPEGVPTTNVPELNIGFDTTLNDLINIRQDGNGNFQVYVNNANDNGEIRFYTKNAMNINDYNYSYLTFSYSEPRLTYNTKINKDGLLQYYHTYHIAYPQKFSGWYTVDYDISALETAQNLIGVGLGTVQGEIVILTKDLGLLNTDYFAFKSTTVLNIADLYNLIHGLYTSSRGLAGWRRSPQTTNTLGDIFTRLGGQVDRTTNLGGSFVLPEILELTGSRLAYLTTFINRFQTASTYGAIGAGIYGIYYIVDKQTQDNANENLLTNQRLRLDIEDNVANGDTSSQLVEHIFIDYLTIDATTNNGFTTAGVYEYVDIGNDATLGIKIKDNGSGTLIAEIISIMELGSGFSVNDEIFIDKSDIGGSTGQLKIVVSQLASYAYILEQEEIKASATLNEVNNRIRRRDNIPNTASFSSDGFSITNTQISEPTGETTNEPTINLKTDTSQFQYDGSGNLQIKSSVLTPPTDPLQFTTDVNTGNLQLIDYDKIAEIGDDTDGAETGLYQYVLNKIEEALGDQETYDANGNVVVPATNIYQEINNIYELVMVGDQTFQNNNDYKLNLGYKTIWNGYAYDLITIALKATRAGIFDSSFYNNDYLGYFPSLTRISDDEYMTPVKDVNVEILTNLTFKKGLVYFEQTDPLIDYDLNRKFEFICFIRPIDTDNTGVEYTLLQTGVEIGPGQYDLDNYKLKLGFRDNHFEITHNVRRVVEYYETLTTKNYYNPGAVTDILVQDATTGTTSISKYVPTNFNLQMLWGIFSQQTYQNVLAWNYLHTLLQRDDTYTHFSNSVFQLYDWNFNTLRDMSNPATTTWASPKIVFHEYQDINLPRRGIGKMVIKYEYRYASSQGNIMGTKTFTSQADIDNNLEFKLRVNIKKYNDPTNTIYGSRIYDIREWQYDPVSLNPPTGYVSFYTMTLWMPHVNYPLLQTDQYNYYELELVHRGGSFTPLPTGSQSYNFYANQHSLRIYSINYFEYDTTPTTFADHSSITFQDTADFFPTTIDTNHWYKVVAELDLPNKVVQYWVDGVNTYFNFDSTVNNIPHSSLQLPQSDPTIPYFYSAEFEFTNQSYTSLVRDNDIIVIGNEPSAGELNFTHFAWKHFQNPAELYMTQAERDKLDFLITYNYYYETVKVDRYLKVKEFYADVLDARKILVNGGFAFNELTTGDQITLLRSDFQSSDNLATTNAFVNIDRLFVSDPVASGNGFLSFDATTKVFGISASTISSADVENAVGNLVKTSPSTYGFIFNQTDPLDKFLQIDDLYINNLINLVIQNELVLTNAFTDNTYNDVLIQVKDASAYSPYNLRELDDVNVRYNYKINGNHQYLYREINQEIQYDPLLGTAFGDLYPVVMYHFQGEIINNARDWLVGIPASDYDFEMLTQGGQVVYGSGPLNMKNFNGVEGGNTQIRTKNVMAITSAFRTCISFFHKPFGSNVDGTDDHKLVEFVDVNNYPVFYIKLEYVSNTAVYKLVFVNPANIADETEFAFNNSENEIYFGNENCILLWCDQPYWHFYINGKYHGVSINQTYSYGASGIRDCKILIDLNYFNNRSLLYELKVYPKLLFKTASGGNLSSTDLTFNNKVVVDVTEMIRIITFTSGGFIIKELSGVQETKSRSIETKVRSLDTSRRVGIVETKLPSTGTGTKGFIYNDGVSDAYNLENPLDLTAVSTTALSLDDRKILTFKQIPNGTDFDIKILSRSNTSTSQARKLVDYSYLGITPLTIYDNPHPPYEYTFLLSYIETQMQAQGYFFQYETNAVGQPTTGSSGLSFLWETLGGDILKYEGADGVWAIYREQNGVYTLIQTFNNGDEFLVDNYKYRLDSLYLRKNNDPNTQIRVFINAPSIFADNFGVGQEFYMNSSLSVQHPTEPLRNWSFTSASSRKQYNHIITDSAGAIRPQFLPNGTKFNTTNGMPADEDTYFKWSWGINYTQIACLMESGDLLLNGNVYVNCPTRGPFDLDNGILVNQIDNLVSPDRASISGIPPLVEQVYYMELTSWDRTNFIAYWTGTDRINTYTNQVVTQFEFYYDDTIEISVSSAVLADIQNFQYHGVGVATPSYSIGMNANNIVSHKFLTTFGSGPYVDVSFGFNYALSQMNRLTIPINLQSIVDYTNEDFLSTDEYILKYKPHTNTFIWEENIGMALDTGVLETSIPVGSFKAKTATTQISSRRTLAPSVPIEKISQKTKYQVFNTEVEVNGNLLLEEINSDVGSLFTIYTNEEKTLGGVPSFKDKASIKLIDSTKEWIFNREPESEDIITATTKFVHNTTELLILKHNQVECGVELKLGTIRFADNTTLTTSTGLTGLLNDISTTNPSYTEFTKDIKLSDGTILSTAPTDGQGFTGGSYNSTTGVVTFTSNDGLGFSTGDLRGADGVDGTNGTNGTNGVDGNDGADGLGFTGGSYNSTTGVVTFTSNDGLGFSTGDLRATYTDSDARSAVYPITLANTGLSGTTSVNLFQNDLWFNSLDGGNRFYFANSSYTLLRAPNVTGNSVVLQVGTTNIFRSYIDKNISYKNLHIGDGTNTTPTLLLDGANGQNVSSQIIFGDSATNPGGGAYKQGMVIFYDSSANYLRISGDNNTDNLLDTPYFVNINRSDGNVSIGDNTTELGFKLKVASNIILKSAVGNNTYDSQVCFGDQYWYMGVSSDGTYYYNQVQGWWNNGNNRGFRLFNRYNNTVPFFVNSSGNIGIDNTAPAYKLDVSGDINTTTTIRTPKIDFNDGTSMTSAPFTPTYLKLYFIKYSSARLSESLEPGAQGSFFDTSAVTLNVGGFTVAINTITIPANGVYDISYSALIRSENNGSDRKIPVSYIRINNADPDGEYQALSSCYLRFRNTTEMREGALSSSTILSLNQNDLVSFWTYREGNTGRLNIQHGHFQIKRIA